MATIERLRSANSAERIRGRVSGGLGHVVTRVKHSDWVRVHGLEKGSPNEMVGDGGFVRQRVSRSSNGTNVKLKGSLH